MLGNNIGPISLMVIHSYFYLRSVQCTNEVLFYLNSDFLLSIVIYDFQESLDALNELLKEPIPINRFRPKY